MIDVEVFSKASPGKKNEDYVLSTEIASNAFLIVVCDGMGGLSNGLDASKIIAHSIEKYLKHNLYSDSPEGYILDAVIYANEELAKECRRLKSKMGASIALILFVDSHCYYTWLGDVRIYSAPGEEIELLTKDHLAIDGNHSFLSRCINGREFRQSIEIEELVVSDGHSLYIATDGYYIHNAIGSEIESVVIEEDDATLVRIKLSGQYLK